MLSSGSGEQEPSYAQLTEERLEVENPAGSGSYRCENFRERGQITCYSGNGNCQGDIIYLAFYDKGNGTFRYEEIGIVRETNSDCDRR